MICCNGIFRGILPDHISKWKFAMDFSGRHIKILTIVLLLVQLCLPISGAFYVADHLQTSAAGHAASSCAHTDAAADHESTDGHEQIPHCHELDAPCDTVPGSVVKHTQSIASLTASYKGALLPGYAALIEIPPKNIV
ncbi:MAG: hypothetical protein GJT30_05445 [Geobacter sp.]|nr:hypothetical protein [Geobacter sp.]